jgi:hypothetical protein
VQIAPGVTPPGLRNTIIVQSANPLTSIQRLPIERELSLSQIRSTRALKLGSSTIDLSTMLLNRNALPNIASRLQAMPSMVSVKASDSNAYVVPQGLVVRSFLNYQIKPGTCGNATRRGQIEAAGISCARRLSEVGRMGEYSNPESPRFVAEPAKRAAIIAKARGDWARQDAETAAEIAKFRAILANPVERQKIVADLGSEETARLEGLSDTDLAGELVSTAETKVETIAFIPKSDVIDRATQIDRAALLPIAGDRRFAELAKTVTKQPIEKSLFLTGFTLGRQYEWSERIEKTIKWCSVGCASTYYAGARAGFSYGFGLRFPILFEGEYTYEDSVGEDRAYLTARMMKPIDGSPADYAAAGLASNQIFRGQEFVAELGAFAGFDYKLPIIGSDSYGKGVDFNLAAMLPDPFTNGHFTPPTPGAPRAESPAIPFIFDQVDLLMGYGNWGVAGILVHPAVKVTLNSNGLRMTLHDNISGRDQTIVTGKRTPVSVNQGSGQSNFWIGDPVYNLSFIVTPGVDAHAFIDVGVWTNDWHFPVWFPQVEIELPPGGIDFSCHANTNCRRDYAFTGNTPSDPSIKPNTVRGEALTGRPVIDEPALSPSDNSRVRPSHIGEVTQEQAAPSRVGEPSYGRDPAGQDATPSLVGELNVQGERGEQAVPSSRVRKGNLGRRSAGTGGACTNGMVPRLATANDSKCVSPDEAQRIAGENQMRSAHQDPNGAYGPETCVGGFVWRDAVPGDKVCVTPERRAAVAAM